jgi:hypothetical protein
MLLRRVASRWCRKQSAFEIQVVEGQLGNLPAGVLRDEPLEETEHVSIAAHGGRAEALHGHEAVEEEGLQMWADGRTHRAVSGRLEAAKASKRRLASCNSSAVMVR